MRAWTNGIQEQFSILVWKQYRVAWFSFHYVLTVKLLSLEPVPSDQCKTYKPVATCIKFGLQFSFGPFLSHTMLCKCNPMPLEVGILIYSICCVHILS